MDETFELTLGEERSVHLAPGADWSYEIDGMNSAVEVRKLWAADPYPEDDKEDEPKPPPDVVFMIRGAAPGSATIRFSASGIATRGAESRKIRVTVAAGD